MPDHDRHTRSSGVRFHARHIHRDWQAAAAFLSRVHPRALVVLKATWGAVAVAGTALALIVAPGGGSSAGPGAVGGPGPAPVLTVTATVSPATVPTMSAVPPSAPPAQSPPRSTPAATLTAAPSAAAVEQPAAPTAAIVPGDAPTVNASGVSLAVEKNRYKIDSWPNGVYDATAFTGAGALVCGYFESSGGVLREHCDFTMLNGTREDHSLVCTVALRDDHSNDPDFRSGDPEPETGTIRFRTPVLPGRWGAQLWIYLPVGKRLSREHLWPDCQFAGV